MHLTLSPRVPHAYEPWVDSTIHVTGDTITIDGTSYDLSPVPEGGEGWPEGDSPFIGPITRSGGVIHCTVLVLLGDTAADDQPDSPWVIEDADGEITIPAARKPAIEVTE